MKNNAISTGLPTVSISLANWMCHSKFPSLTAENIAFEVSNGHLCSELTQLVLDLKALESW